MTVCMENSRGTVVFGTEGFILHRLIHHPTVLNGTDTDVRHVEIRGYILPEGETAAARADAREKLTRRLTRICADTAGFTLSYGDKRCVFRCTETPAFSSDEPFLSGDAAFFTVKAESVGSACFEGTEIALGGTGVTGNLIFPLTVTETTVFGRQAATGVLHAHNPGDVPCGFLARITVGEGGMSAFTLRCGEHTITVRAEAAAGQTLLIDTRTGRKNVSLGGIPRLDATDWRSEFFPLQPGDNELTWESTGDGSVFLSLTYTPQYW